MWEPSADAIREAWASGARRRCAFGVRRLSPTHRMFDTK
jgi:hypothetical protein